MSTPEHDASEVARARLDLRLARRLLRLLAPVRGAALGLIGLELLLVTSIFLRPWFLGQVIDHGILHDRVDWMVCLLMASGLFGVWIVRFGIGGFSDWLAGRMAIDVLRRLREQVFAHVQQLSLGWFDRSQAGRIISRVDRDVDALEAAVVHIPPELISTVLRCTSAGLILAWIDLHLLFSVLLLVLLLAIAVIAYQRLGITLWGRVAEAKSAVTAHLCETITGVKVIQQSAAEGGNLQRYHTLLLGLNRRVIGAAWGWGWFQPFTAVLFVLGVAILVIVGGGALAEGRITPGQFAQSVFYVFLFLGPLQELGDLFEKLATASASAMRVFALLDVQPEITDAPTAIDAPRSPGEVHFDHVTFRYLPAGPDVIRDLTLHVAAGQTLALVGPTGHGKSTIAQLLARFYQAQHGSVRLDGHDVRDVTQASLRRHVAVVLQDNLLFSGTVLDNVRLACPHATDAQLRQAVRDLGADEVLEHLPQGLLTEVGPLGASLSAGQRQLVCLVRAWLADPVVLVLDEATSAIDLHTEQRIQRALRRLCAGRTAIIIAHRLSTIRDAHRIAVVRDGRISEFGTHAELLEKSGEYAQLHQAH